VSLGARYALVVVALAAAPFGLDAFTLAARTLGLCNGLFAYGLDLAWGRAGLLSLMFLEQALTGIPGGPGGSIRIGMVSSHLHEVVDGDRVEPAKATVLGASKVIHQESAHLTCCSIDVVPPAPGSPAEERLAAQLLAELSVLEPDMEPAVAYRGRQRWVRR